MAVTCKDYLPYALEHEGSTGWMYLDTVGRVTVGIGHMIPTPAAAVALPFLDRVGRTAAPDAVRAAFAAVQGARNLLGRGAGAFQGLTTPRLDGAGVAAVFSADFDRIVGRIRALFTAVDGGFDSYPDPAQLALIDMAFNLGPTGLYAKFPRFRAALARRDFVAAVEECRRVGIQPSRNAWTRQMLAQAARIEAAVGQGTAAVPDGCSVSGAAGVR